MWHCKRCASCRTRQGTMSCARICCKVVAPLPTLFHTSFSTNTDADSLRRRRGADDGTAETDSLAGGNMNEAVKYYNTAQEKITEHMLSLTRNLKEQTETANRIIRRDTEVVSRSSNMTERNINSLSKEAEKLEQHSRKAYKCWLWLMIVFVIVVFICES